MLSLLKTKVSKNYIYAKKHQVSMYSLEELIQKFKKSGKDYILEVVNFYLKDLNYDKFRFIIKLLAHSDGKIPLNITQIKDYIEQLVTNAVEKFASNLSDANYISESLIVTISSYNGKHYLSICPRYDFLK